VPVSLNASDGTTHKDNLERDEGYEGVGEGE
jgi:hypothetical protein